MKTCSACGASKPFEGFYRAAGMRDGHRSECKACNLAARARKYRDDPRPAIERAMRWARENPERYQARQRAYVESGRKSLSSRKSHLKRKYGLTLEDFDGLLESQGGGCAICDRTDADNVDHDHETGRVRGILCFNCNIAVGQLDNDEDRAIAVASYLARDDELTGLARARRLALTG